MVFMNKVALVGLMLTTAACTNPDRFGDSNAGAGANGSAVGGLRRGFGGSVGRLEGEKRRGFFLR